MGKKLPIVVYGPGGERKEIGTADVEYDDNGRMYVAAGYLTESHPLFDGVLGGISIEDGTHDVIPPDPPALPLVHNEPYCTEGNGCRYMEPHRHGLACDRSCTECEGNCHPDCPVYGKE